MPINHLDDDFRLYEKDRTELESGLPSKDRALWLASRNIDENQRLALLERIATHHQYGYIDGLLIDVITGGWLWALYLALSEKNRQKFISYDVAVMIDTMYKLQDKGAINLSIG